MEWLKRLARAPLHVVEAAKVVREKRAVAKGEKALGRTEAALGRTEAALGETRQELRESDARMGELREQVKLMKQELESAGHSTSITEHQPVHPDVISPQMRAPPVSATTPMTPHPHPQTYSYHMNRLSLLVEGYRRRALTSEERIELGEYARKGWLAAWRKTRGAG
ncbi:hypothetical protein HYS54_00065 [Candidatus Micrarchaeota archaeon]|nr:hypothetical protein [Candidatus Micrarchaeota archaeon]